MTLFYLYFIYIYIKNIIVKLLNTTLRALEEKPKGWAGRQNCPTRSGKANEKASLHRTLSPTQNPPEGQRPKISKIVGALAIETGPIYHTIVPADH